MRRRNFVTLLGCSAIAYPLVARAQQPKMPAIGLLDFGSLELSQESLAGFHRGLAETGYVEGQNVTIEYRGAEGRSDRLPTLAADLVRRQVAAIVMLGAGGSDFAARAATSTIPILCNIGGDPVKLGLVATLNRPGGNLTGVSNFAAVVETKRFGLLSELVRTPARIAALLNPNGVLAKSKFEELQSAARAVGREIEILNAGSEGEIDSAFATLVQLRIGALFVSSDGFFTFQRDQLVALAARHAVPATRE